MNQDKFMSFSELATLMLPTKTVFRETQWWFWNMCAQFIQNPNATKQKFEEVKQGFQTQRFESPDEPTAALNVMSQIQNAIENPSDDGMEFLAMFKNLYQLNTVKCNTDQRYDVFKSLMLDKISTLITDERAKYDILKAMDAIVRPNTSEISKKILIMRAKNPNATVWDLINLMDIYPENAMVEKKQIFADVENMVNGQLESELQKTAPDIEKIKNLVNAVLSAVNRTNDHALIAKIQDQYKVEKLVSSESVEYVQKIPQDRIQKIENLERELANLRMQLEYSKNRISALESQLTSEQEANQKAQGQIAALESENATLRNNKDKAVSRINQLASAAEKLKGGLMSSGVNDFKQMVAKIAMEQKDN